MLNVVVITLFPEMFSALSKHGVSGRAVESGLLDLSLINPRTFTDDVHRTVDDRPYGGGPGMVMRYQPLKLAIDEARRRLPSAKVVYLTPQGRRLQQEDLSLWEGKQELILLCGRYEGIDERLILAEVEMEWSIGDYVLSGGELPAMVVIDAMTRSIPGVLGNEDSAGQDSFSQGLLDYPHYTRPEEVDGMTVPAVLTGGNHRDIARWRLQQSLGRTWQRRPDLLAGVRLDPDRQALLDEFIIQQEKDIE